MAVVRVGRTQHTHSSQWLLEAARVENRRASSERTSCKLQAARKQVNSQVAPSENCFGHTACSSCLDFGEPSAADFLTNMLDLLVA